MNKKIKLLSLTLVTSLAISGFSALTTKAFSTNELTPNVITNASYRYNCSASRVGNNVRVNITSNNPNSESCYAFVTFTGKAPGSYRTFSLENSTGRSTVSASNSFSKIVNNPLSYSYVFQKAFVAFYVNEQLVDTKYVY